MISYGDTIGKETINTEFKEFSIYDDISEKTIKKIINSKIIDKTTINEFIECVNNNLKSNFIKYIPKYIACFSNSNLDGSLYVGIGNDGKYYGIPHFDLTVEKIREMIIECKEYIDCDIINKIDIEIININKKNINKIVDKSKILLKKHFDKSVFESSEYYDYINKKNRNLKNINKYRCKIGMVVTNLQLRKECIKFVEKFCSDKLIIDKITNDLNTLTEEISSDYIQLHKNDKSHIIYWITEFRDYYTNHYTNKISRKSNNYKYLNSSPYKYIYKSMKNFIPFLMKDDRINIYVIKFIFTNKNIQNIKYKNQNDSTWIFPFRTLDKYSEPITITISNGQINN